MNGLGKISKRGNSGFSRGQRSVSIFEAIRQARMLKGKNGNNGSTLLHKDWGRNQSK